MIHNQCVCSSLWPNWSNIVAFCSHTGSEKQTLTFIQLNTEYEAHFTGHRNSRVWLSIKHGWEGHCKMYSDAVTDDLLKKWSAVNFRSPKFQTYVNNTEFLSLKTIRDVKERESKTYKYSSIVKVRSTCSLSLSNIQEVMSAKSVRAQGFRRGRWDWAMDLHKIQWKVLSWAKWQLMNYLGQIVKRRRGSGSGL